MANVTVGALLPANFAAIDLSILQQLTITERTSTSYIGDLRNLGVPDDSYQFFGADFQYDANGIPTSGTVTLFQEVFAGDLVIRYEDFNIPVGSFLAAVYNGQSAQLVSSILAGADTITASPFSDVILAYGGNDFINLREGDDIIEAGAGNDLIIGGVGIDAIVLAGVAPEYQEVVWADTVAFVPVSDAALAASGIDKAVGVEIVSTTADALASPIGPTNFSPLDYIASYADLSAAFGADANAGFDHYIYNGLYEGRTTTFSGLEYIASYGDLIAAFGPNAEAGALHYLNSGRGEGRTDSFDGLQYIASHADLITAFGADRDVGTLHYIDAGFKEGRSTDSFDAAQYLTNYADLQNAFGDDQQAATIHYITTGFSEGRTDDRPGAILVGDGTPSAAEATADFIF